ncbi:MAG TPA: VCBS repeat-containing protein, partial [Kofleriaceae bacterium]|nr:VCBS repeat-containing protein [Kofleriaceae bacterium]
QAIAGDFNGDGHQDVLVGSSTTGAVKLYTGDGSGMVTFAQDISLPGGVVRELAAFDLDHDGRTDFVAIQSAFDGSNQSIVVCYGLASGFSAPVVLTPSGLVFAQGIAAGDFDHDGRTDLAIGTFGSDATNNATIDVFLATDTGFELGGTLTVPGGHLGSDFAVGDFNGDGFDDLATTALGAVAVFLSTP